MNTDLLWKAYPDGYLAIRGVSTVRKWTCLGSSPVAAIEFVSDRREDGTDQGPVHKFIGFDEAGQPLGDSTAAAEELHRRGVFLPNVDPTDAATWACLLKDLAEAAEITERTNLTWRRFGGKWVLGGDPWNLENAILTAMTGLASGATTREQAATQVLADQVKTTLRGFDINTDEPAEALVQARIHLRETESANRT